VRFSHTIHRQVVCDLAEATGRFWTSLDRCAVLQEVRSSEKIRKIRYQHSGLLVEPSGRDEDVFKAFSFGYFAFRVAHRDNGCSHKLGPVRNGYASMLGNRSRSFVVIGWPVSMRARFVECGASCKLTRLFFFFRRNLVQSMFGTDEKMYVGGFNYGHRLI
jgi:hypothetical protein